MGGNGIIVVDIAVLVSVVVDVCRTYISWL
jgi:hypothetical protein